MKKYPLSLLLLVVSFIYVNAAQAAQYVYPAKGQSQEQQDKDEYACHKWATDKTGYDPTRAASQAPTYSAPAQADSGSVARGALRGAGRGWIIGEIADGDSGDAALAGAILGGLRGQQESRYRQQQARNNQAAAVSAYQQDYLRAKSACLESKGYTVR